MPTRVARSGAGPSPLALLLVVTILAALALLLQQQLFTTGLSSLPDVPRQVAASLHAVAAEQQLGSRGATEELGGGGGGELPPSPPTDHIARPAGTSGVPNNATASRAPARPSRPPAISVGAPHSRCASRRPYHVVMTAARGVYQEWQSRIAYYHYKKQKDLNPCSDLGGFTRLLNSPGAQPDGLMDEIPTMLVQQLQGGGRCDRCDHGFVVMNRPYGLLQLVESAAFQERVPEAYMLLLEPDHLMLRPLPNEATPTTPVGFGFYYMTYRYDPKKLKPVVARWHAPDAVDPVGPSPLLISKAQFSRLVRPWWELCLELKRDRQADAAFGWVLEMWGYALASARLGVKHKVLSKLQAEPGGAGIASLDGYSIFHYTFDLEVGRGGWKWSKRTYMGYYPSRPFPKPPPTASRSTLTFQRMMDEAMGALASWKPLRAVAGRRGPGG